MDAMDAICNFCESLEKDFINPNDNRFFNARCSKCSIETSSVKRGRTIEYHTFNGDNIHRPIWCPKSLKKEGEGKEPEQKQLPFNEETEKKPKEFKDLTYLEKKNVIKGLKPIVEWEDIKVNGIYVIPPVMASVMKVIRVEEIDDTSIKYREISQYTNTEYSYSSYISRNSDVEQIVLVALHKF